MAHALRRISYATCDPAHAQFSFLAREPKGHFSLQYCHSFVTKTPEQVRFGFIKLYFFLNTGCSRSFGINCERSVIKYYIQLNNLLCMTKITKPLKQ